MSVIEINLHLKPEILDPQGRAILETLRKLGLSQVLDVRQGKQIKLYFKDEISEEFMNLVKNLTDSFLSNPILENYSIEVTNES